MIYPEFLKQGGTIGITAPSDGIGEDELKNIRLDSAKKQLTERGYRVKETASVRKSVQGRSADAKTRAKEYMELVTDPEVGAIFASGGGDWLFEMLPYLDYKKIAENPTWFEGMSDPTGICYTVTTLADVATVYGTNVSAFGMKPWDEKLEDNFKILEGCMITQKNGDMYQSGWLDLTDGLDVYKKDTKTLLKRLDYSSRNVIIKESGRLIGGCMDVLVEIAGTRFDGTKDFVRRYADDGCIWYLEVFSMTPEQLASYLWKFRESGWFDTAKAFLFGRPCFINDDYSLTTYEDAVMSVLGPLSVPVMAGLDIGHRPPALTLINGALAEINFDGTDFSIDMKLV